MNSNILLLNVELPYMDLMATKEDYFVMEIASQHDLKIKSGEIEYCFG